MGGRRDDQRTFEELKNRPRLLAQTGRLPRLLQGGRMYRVRREQHAPFTASSSRALLLPSRSHHQDRPPSSSFLPRACSSCLSPNPAFPTFGFSRSFLYALS